MNNFPNERILVFDIEATSTNPEEAKLRYFGAYSYVTKERYFIRGTEDLELIQELFTNHDVLVSYNGKKYDHVVLNRYGISHYGKIIVDLYEILADPRLDPKTRERSGGKGRGSFMGLKLNSWSMANVAKALEVGEDKGDIDYNIFKKEPGEWSVAEEQEIITYLDADITLTKRIFERTHKFYFPITEFLDETNISRMTYLTSSVASMAYKIICHEAGLPETYGDGEKPFDYVGGYVKEPVIEEYVGDVICYDFASLYPSIFRGFNLFSPARPDEEAFEGNDLFHIKGRYKKDKLGIVEQTVARLYKQRAIYKKQGDKREYLLKICLNCFTPDTEILTINGVKKFDDLKIGEIVPSINPTNKELEYKKVNDVIRKHYEGNLYHIKTKYFDWKVTEDHRFIVEKENGELLFKTAKELYNGFKGYIPLQEQPIDYLTVPDKKEFISLYHPGTIIWFECRNNKTIGSEYNAEYVGHQKKYRIYTDGWSDKKIISLFNKLYSDNRIIDVYGQAKPRHNLIRLKQDLADIYTLAGWYISEGSSYVSQEKVFSTTKRGVSYNITIHQDKDVNKNYYDEIIICLKNIGISYRKDNNSISFSNKLLFDFLTKNFGVGSENKFISKNIKETHPYYLFKLFHSMYKGDGKKNQSIYTTKSKKLRDDIMDILVYLGFHCFYRFDGCWRIFFNCNKHWIDQRNITKEYYSGDVVCCNVQDNHTIYAGRNGNLNWTGQSLYGITPLPVFEQLYNRYGAEDCTYIGRTMTKYAGDYFDARGYTTLYSDTDSVFVALNDHTKEEANEIAKELERLFLDNMPFPHDDFGFDIDYEIKAMFFFKDDDGRLKKKNYVYITQDDKLKIKGLPIIKSNASKIAVKVFRNHLKKQIISKKKVKFRKDYLKQLIFYELENDITLAAQVYKVRDFAYYEENPSSLYAQISQEYGEGVHLLVTNNRLGVGKDKKYCTLDEFRSHGLTLHDVNLDATWSNLSPFCQDPQKSIFDF